MYIVVSKWAYEPSQKEAFQATGRKMRDALRNIPGVESLQAIECEDGNALAIACYSDHDTYKKIMAEGGPFDQAAKKHGIEGVGQWQWSERGEEIADMATV